MENSNNQKEDIAEFVKKMVDRHGHLPKFAQNMVGKNPEKVYYAGPYFDKNEMIAAIDALLFGKWSSAGEYCAKFEREFSKVINQKSSFFCNSGSSANLVLIAACKEYYGWKDEDEIIISALGFPTTTSAVVQNNLKPVFVDIEWKTLNFDLDLIEQKITNRTKAVFLSPILGNPCDIDKLSEICKRHNIEILLDSCDSLGCKWKGKDLTEYSIGSTCSFYVAHEISTISGGMVSSNNEEIVSLARSFGTWGRACFPAGTKIITDRGDKNIEKINVGDMVFTHNGNLKKVKKTFKSDYSGEMVEINCEKRKNVHGTSNHKFYVLKTGGERLSRLRDSGKFPNPQWVEAKDLVKGDLVLERIGDTKNYSKLIKYKYDTLTFQGKASIPLGPDFMRLVGYYLAEGSLAKSLKGASGYKENKYFKYRVDFAFNKNELEYIHDVQKLMKKYFSVSSTIRRVQKSNGVIINCTSRKGYEFFHQFFGYGASNKNMPEEFIYLNKSLLKELLKGFWRGDGSLGYSDYKDRRTAFTICSTSSILIEQFRRILLRLGINPGSHVRTPERHVPSKVNGKLIVARHNLNILSLYGNNAKKMNSLIGEKYGNFSKKNHIHFAENGEYAIYKIKNIRNYIVENLPVYNLSVENDSSYHANGLTVHNCHCVGVCNLLPNGTCGKRFFKWIPDIDITLDHRYVFDRIGWNLQQPDILGAIGLEQLKKLNFICDKRIENANSIKDLFSKYVNEIAFPEVLSNSYWVPFGVPVICKNKEQKFKLVSYLENHGIQTRNAFAGNLLAQKGYRHLGNYLDYPEANKILSHVFFVGCAPSISEQNLEYIEETLKKWPNLP